MKKLGFERLILQIGNGTIIPQNKNEIGIHIEWFRFKDSLLENIKEADLVISHAGAGSCLEVLEYLKPLIVVINEDLMDNHQLELAEQLYSDGHLYYTRCKELSLTLQTMDTTNLKPFGPGNANLFSIYLNNLFGNRKQ